MAKNIKSKIKNKAKEVFGLKGKKKAVDATMDELLRSPSTGKIYQPEFMKKKKKGK